MGFGQGGDGRINFGLLHVLNSIHRAIADNTPAIEPTTAMALCRNGPRVEHWTIDTLAPTGYGLAPIPTPTSLPYKTLTPLAKPEDFNALKPIGMEGLGGLLCDNHGNRPQAQAFLRREAARIADLIKATGKPKIVEIFIDVFGFSRGAAQARVFCNWLGDFMQGDLLCGVPAKIRFLGIFDTVASVGPPSRAAPFDLTNGHYAWGRTYYLRVPAAVKNCVHYVAMHENRASFPSDKVRLPDGSLPANCRQFMLPGMHSDVGGGYEPTQQGRGLRGDDSEKLSQMPLEMMYQAAQAAKVPVYKALATERHGNQTYDPFAVDPGLRKAFTDFMQVMPVSGTQAEWLLPYLAWRYQVRTVYDKLSWFQRAGTTDRSDLIGANGTLLADIAAIHATDTAWKSAAYTVLHQFPLVREVIGDQAGKVRKLAPEARTLLSILQAQAILGTPENPEQLTPQAVLFANYAHDSYAGFRPFDTKFAFTSCQDWIPGSWEPEGYLRYRRYYIGNDSPQVSALQLPPPPPPSEQELYQQQMQNYINMHGIDFSSLH
ncbi:hypothetical protein ASG87_18445 [Frateuria sp. Soil773]|nr:hypothetical protein ASG87_18445 [Frateuria sp. Soil773]